MARTKKLSTPQCEWTYTSGFYAEEEYYETNCGETYTLFEDGGTPEQHHFYFCPGCGRVIHVKHPRRRER